MIDNQNQSSQVVSLGELLGEEQNLIQTDNQLNEEEPNLRNHEYTELIKNYPICP